MEMITEGSEKKKQVSVTWNFLLTFWFVRKMWRAILPSQILKAAVLTPYKLYGIRCRKPYLKALKYRQIKKSSYSKVYFSQQITSQTHGKPTHTSVVLMYRLSRGDRMAPEQIMTQPSFTLPVKIYDNRGGKLFSLPSVFRSKHNIPLVLVHSFWQQVSLPWLAFHDIVQWISAC